MIINQIIKTVFLVITRSTQNCRTRLHETYFIDFYIVSWIWYNASKKEQLFKQVETSFRHSKASLEPQQILVNENIWYCQLKRFGVFLTFRESVYILQSLNFKKHDEVGSLIKTYTDTFGFLFKGVFILI